MIVWLVEKSYSSKDKKEVKGWLLLSSLVQRQGESAQSVFLRTAGVRDTPFPACRLQSFRCSTLDLKTSLHILLNKNNNLNKWWPAWFSAGCQKVVSSSCFIIPYHSTTSSSVLLFVFLSFLWRPNLDHKECIAAKKFFDARKNLQATLENSKENVYKALYRRRIIEKDRSKFGKT